MRIAVLTMDFLPGIGGVQTYLYQVLKRVSMHHQVTVITSATGKLPMSGRLRRVVLERDAIFSYWQTVSRLHPDRILVGHAHPRLLLAAALARSGRYALLTYGNDYLAGQQRWHRPLFNWLMGRACPFVTITRANAARLQHLGLPRPNVVHPGTDPARFKPPPHPPPPPLRLLTVGRLVPRKGIDTVLQTLPSLLEAVPTLRYHVVGDGPDRPRLEALAEELRVAPATTFHGRVPDDELPELYRQSHVFVMPTREVRQTASVEGFGIVYLEAAASGLPVVASRSGGAAEAVRHGETGLLVAPVEDAALAAALHRLLADAPLRRRLGAAGRRWVESEMNWDRAARQLADLLDG